MTETKKKESEKALRQHIEALEAELIELRAIVAKVDHEKILQRLPTARDEFTSDIPQRVIALGAQGLPPVEIITELGISEDNWRAWISRYPEMRAAASRARSLGRAYWLRKGRTAIETNNWRFNLEKLPRLVETMFADGEQDVGDASALIVFHIGKSGQVKAPD